MLTVVLFFTAFGRLANAENPDAQAPVPFDPQAAERLWQESIADLKKGAEALLDEHERLESENSSLVSKSTNTQKSVEDAKSENTRLVGEPARLNKLIEEKNTKSKSLEKEIKVLETRVASLTKERDSLMQKLSRLAEKQKPWEIKIADLTTRKTQLRVDLKLKEATPAQEVEDLRAQIREIKDLLAGSREKEEGLRSAINGISREYSSNPSEIGRLKNEIDELQTELSRTKGLRGEVTREAAVLRKGGAMQRAPQQTALAQKLETKALELENEIARIHRAKGTASSLALESSGENRFEDVERLENEHQDLESRIFDLSEAILVLRRENAMNEALLGAQKQAQEDEAASSRAKGETEEQSVTEAMGYAFASQGLYEEAVEKYLAALKQGGNKKNIYFNLGTLYFKMGNVPEAIKNYQQVLKIDPGDLEAKRNLEELRKNAAR